MGFYVRFDDVQDVDVYARSKLSAMQEKLSEIEKAIGTLSGASGFEGQAASKAKSYLSDVHGLLHASIQTILIEYQQMLLLYKDGLHTEVDSNPHAEFDEDRLSDVERVMSERVAEFEAEAAELESAVGSVADLLSFFGPRNASSVAADIRHSGDLACSAREAVGQYEYAHAGDLSSVRGLLGDLDSVLGQYIGADGSLMTSYSPESLGANASVVSLANGLQQMHAGQRDRAPAMEDVYLREEDRAAVLEAEAAAERAKWGWIKAVGAVVTIAVGVIVIVASAGTATPLVVVGAAGLSTLFGASNLVEAAGDIYYGSRGDAYTQAFNPLRDTVFGGNQTLYDIADFAVCAVASAGIPLTQAAKLGQLSRMTVVRAAVREGVEDLATQKLAEVATPYLGAEGALAAAMVAGTGMGRVGGGAPKGPDASTAAPGSGVSRVSDLNDVPRIRGAYIPRASSDWGVAFFGPTNLNYYLRQGATLGTEASPFFHMSMDDALRVGTPHDALRETGRAPSLEREVLGAAEAGMAPEVYGLAFPRDGLASRVPGPVDAGGWPHYLEGGRTAVRLDDASGRPGTGGFLVNQTREYVIDGGPPVPAGAVLFKLLEDGSWQPVLRF